MNDRNSESAAKTFTQCHAIIYFFPFLNFRFMTYYVGEKFDVSLQVFCSLGFSSWRGLKTMKRGRVTSTNRWADLCLREKRKRDCILYSFGPLFLDIDVYFLPMVLKHFCRLRLIVKNNPKLVWFCFAILFEILWYKLMQIRCEPKLFMTWSRVFCRAKHSHWFILLLTFIVTSLVWVYDGQMLKKNPLLHIHFFSYCH